ncbi:MAG: hypothetical protein ACLQQ4_15110 [Bacteroidia bacterium]
MEQDPCYELYSDETVELTHWGLKYPGDSASYEKDGWLLTIISDKEDFWKLETPDGKLIIAIGNVLSHKGYNDELFRISSGNELLLEWMGGIVKNYGMTKRAPLMFYINGTTRLITNGSGLWKLCLPDGSFTAGSGDLFRDDAFSGVRDNMVSQCCEKFTGVLKRRFDRLYKNNAEYDFKVLPGEELWVLSYRPYEKYMGFGNPFNDGIFAQCFSIPDEGRLAIWLKNKLEKYGIHGREPRLWHFVEGKFRSIVGELSGGKVFNPNTK